MDIEKKFSDLQRQINELASSRLTKQNIVPGAISPQDLTVNNTPRNGDLVYSDGTNFVTLPPGSINQFLMPVSTGGITWQSLPAGVVLDKNIKLDMLNSAISTTNLATSSTNYIDYTGLSVTFTPAVASNALVLFTSNFSFGFVHTSASFVVNVDGSTSGNDPLTTSQMATDGNISQSVSSFLWVTGLTAAAHTIKIQAKGTINSGASLLVNTSYGSLLVIPFAS